MNISGNEKRNGRLMANDLGVVFAAGGSGKRFAPDGAINKLFADLKGLPVFLHSIISFSEVCLRENMVLVVNGALELAFSEMLEEYLPNSGIRICAGGDTRMDSVYNGLLKLPETTTLAAVHDAARPLASANLLLDAYDCAKKYGNAVAGRRITDTVKRTDRDGIVTEDIDRERLWSVETPQIFDKEKLLAAYVKAFDMDFRATDDAGVMMFSGYPVKMFENMGKNSKLTFYGDLNEM